MGKKGEGGYYAVIPSAVRYNDELPPNAKLLYGELTALCDRDGYCWATNDYFAELYHVAAGTVSRWVSMLEKLGFIRTEMAVTEKGTERRIYAGLFIVTEGGVHKNVKTPLHKNVEGGIHKNVNTPQGNILNINNTQGILPPIAPQGGAAPPERKRAKREIKALPDWKPDRFVGFWSYYPRGENKQGAIRAWDKLQPDDELINRMAHALKRLKATEEWRAGVGIPHASTWLNNSRWEDADRLPDPRTLPGSGGWDEDQEVI